MVRVVRSEKDVRIGVIGAERQLHQQQRHVHRQCQQYDRRKRRHRARTVVRGT